MRTCYTAALVLLGWYLMLPPRLAEHTFTFDTHAALSKWYFVSFYGSANDCEESRGEFNSRWINAISHRASQLAISDIEQWQAAEKCVSNDDPRLEGKGIRFGVPIRILPPPHNLAN